ncbi:MAG: Type 1 glutamine amidotransferase-like domain-containing protein [Planctomycetota bacterium]
MRSPFSVLCLLVIALCAAILSGPAFSQAPTTTPHIRPIDGSRMVVGDGKIAEYTVKCFLHLCRQTRPTVAIIRLAGSTRITEARLKETGAGSVTVIDSLPSDQNKLTMQLIDATGVWIEGNVEALKENDLLIELLKNVTHKNGVIAVGSKSVSLLPELDQNDFEQRLRSPFAKCDFHMGARVSGANAKDAEHRVQWWIPKTSTLVFHSGRRIAGYGYDDVRVSVPKANGWPERRGTFECPDVFSPGSYPFYGLDLLSWVRSANERDQALFPAKNAATPVVENGTLFLHGGSRIEPDMMRQFVELVGGKGSPIVCIPSASRFDWSQAPNSYSEDVLASIDHFNVEVLHTQDPLVAHESAEFERLLKNAKGVWIDGGRTYRFMDSYQGTRVEKLIAEVLKRGGVVGGSSAGCQVPSEFLVRGNPRTNRDIVHGGYTRGLGLLKGTIIDAHFLQRERGAPFLELMRKHPQMLGIGIDERTALIVKGSLGRVVGPNAVSFYDLKTKTDGDFQPVILKAGEAYDLKLRERAK